MAYTDTVRQLMETPTAPGREQWMVPVVRRLLGEIPGVVVTRDTWGNIYARLRRGSAPRRCVAFVAHLDHPGFVVDSVEGRTVKGTFEGGVQDPYFKTEGVRLFRSKDDKGIRAKVAEVSSFSEETHNRTVTLEAEEDAAGAVLGMWDLKPFEVVDGMIHSRGVDDLGGCALLIETLRGTAARGEDCDLLCVFTRSEENGFRGALLLCTAPDAAEWLPRDAWVISVETSSARANTPIGKGAVLRVGDKSTIFNPEITRAIQDISESLSKQGKMQPLVRALMDGGTCEATCFNIYGWTSGAVCVPLGNYHNMNVAEKKIDREFISVSDAESLTTAMTELALYNAGGGETASARLKKMLDKLAEDSPHRLAEIN